MKDHFNISVSNTDLEEAFVKALNHPHKNIIAKAVVNNLKLTSLGYEHLFKALLGIEILPKFQIDDEIWLNYENAPTWRMNEDLMRQNNMIFQGKIKGRIKDINMYSTEQYEISFEHYNKEENLVEDVYWVREYALQTRKEEEINIE